MMVRSGHAREGRLKELIALLACLPFLAVACGSKVPVPPAEAPRATPPAATPTALPSPSPTPTAEPAPNQACIDCHSDKQRLIDAAAPEAPVEVESSGEG